MDYGNPKILPNTGAGVLLVGTLLGQFIATVCIMGVVICSALILRALWRRKRSIGQ